MEVEQGSPRCIICAASLTLSSARRTLHPPIPANQEVRASFLQFVAGASAEEVFQVSSAESRHEYACKPCYGKLERASRHHIATRSLIGELRATAQASGRFTVAGNEPAYSARAATTPTGAPTRKRPQDSAGVGSTPKRPRIEEQQQQLGEDEGAASPIPGEDTTVPACPFPTGLPVTPPCRANCKACIVYPNKCTEGGH